MKQIKKYGVLLLATACISTQAKADQVLTEDLIVVGNQCIGQDCVNSEQFNNASVKLKENNTRLRLLDETSSENFGKSWNLEANSSSNGGGSYFQIEMKSAVKDIQQVSDGTTQVFNTETQQIEVLPQGTPVVSPYPNGEPVMTDFQTEPYLNLGVLQDTRASSSSVNSVTIGYNSVAVDNSISVGAPDMLRQLKNLASAVKETDLLIRQQLSFNPFAQQKLGVTGLTEDANQFEQQLAQFEQQLAQLEQQLTQLEQQTTELDVQVTVAECKEDCVVFTNTGAGSSGAFGLVFLMIFALFRKLKTIVTLLISVALLGITPFANANENPWSVNFTFGQSNLSPLAEQNNFSLGDHKDDSLKLSLNYAINNDWAIEMFWSDLGSVEVISSRNIFAGGNIDYQTSGAGALFSRQFTDAYPLAYRLRAGFSSIDIESHNIQMEESSSIRFYVGAGLTYSLNEQWGLTFDFDRYSKDSESVLFGVSYSF